MLAVEHAGLIPILLVMPMTNAEEYPEHSFPITHKALLMGEC